MAKVRLTDKQIFLTKGRVDRQKLNAITQDEIRRFMAEDGYDPDTQPEFKPNLATQARLVLGLTQQQMADLTKIPIATLRNWEQNRTRPAAGATAFFRLLLKIPGHAKKALTEQAA
jgi:putative transcriptional regulator